MIKNVISTEPALKGQSMKPVLYGQCLTGNFFPLKTGKN